MSSSAKVLKRPSLSWERNGGSLWLMITDVKLAGQMDGVELAHIAKEHVPDLEVIVTSGKPLRQALPEGAKFWSKPWVPLDVIREAERMSVSHRTDVTRSRAFLCAPKT